jgi:hypothetical protein
MTVSIESANINKIRLAQQVGNPSAPATGFDYLFVKSDGQLYIENPAGDILGPMGVANIGNISGRLTLTSGTAVTTSDVTSATILYFTPHKGNLTYLYNSAIWVPHTFNQKQLSLSGLTSGTSYDIFLYNNAGTLSLEAVAWSGVNTRATALVLQDGVYVKTGELTKRYIGTIRTSNTGQCEDSISNRLVWNYYNRAIRRMFVSATNAHAYGTAAWRSWNNNAGLRVGFVLGLIESPVIGSIYAEHKDSGQAGIGLDSTTSVSFVGSTPYIEATVNLGIGGIGTVFPSSAGYHFAQAVEYGWAAGSDFSSFNITLSIDG